MFNLLKALALLADYIGKEDPSIRIGAILGLGLAYAGCQNDQVKFIVSGLVLGLGRIEIMLVYGRCMTTLSHLT